MRQVNGPAPRLEDIYDELRRVAAGILAGEKPGHLLEPCALVHELWLRSGDGGSWVAQARKDLAAISRYQMRQLLVDDARARRTIKRGGRLPLAPRQLSAIDASGIPAKKKSARELDVSEAFSRLHEQRPQLARVVCLRVYGGCSHEEVAAILEVTPRTARRYWTDARNWLRRELNDEKPLGRARPRRRERT